MKVINNNYQQFVSNNRGINAGGDFPAPFMEKLYDNITNNEFVVSNERKEERKKRKERR